MLSRISFAARSTRPLSPVVALSGRKMASSPAPVASTSKLSSATECSTDYDAASREDLVKRIVELESSLRQSLPHTSSATRSISSSAEKKSSKGKGRRISPAEDGDFFDRYPSRKIALKFSYEGWPYCGLALQAEKEGSSLPLPTVEAVLLDALAQARLIKPELKRDTDTLGFSRCGRTDRGVSAAGQVVSLWVRSQLREDEGRHELAWRPAVTQHASAVAVGPSEEAGSPQTRSTEGDEATQADLANTAKQKAAAKNQPKDELPYMSLLNRCLPPSIRILGWSPVREDFDARFSCQGRHYKYFFSSTPLAPLDIDAMQDAASRLVGEHDFRNLCKVDPTKQITNFRRRIVSAVISELDSARNSDNTHDDKHYVLDLQGSAFLYHQVRHIMAILFLVGSRRESASIVDAINNTGYTAGEIGLDRSSQPDMAIVASKPSYEMADDLPLVLWDCQFRDQDVDWRQDANSAARSKAYADMHLHTSSLDLKSTISQHFLRAFRELGEKAHGEPVMNASPGKDGIVQVGAGRTIGSGRYTPLLQRPRAELVEVINQRWMDGQGKRRAERRAAAGADDTPKAQDTD